MIAQRAFGSLMFLFGTVAVSFGVHEFAFIAALGLLLFIEAVVEIAIGARP